jgi:hypothetical protein
LTAETGAFGCQMHEEKGVGQSGDEYQLPLAVIVSPNHRFTNILFS